MVREAPERRPSSRLNPRKDWYANVEAIEAPDPYTVVFRLKRPQPSLLLMLASGYSPVYPAHVPLAELRGPAASAPGPFKLKEWRTGEFVEYVKNPDYFVKGRPYLDGIKLHRSSASAAPGSPRCRPASSTWSCRGEMTKTIAEQLKSGAPPSWSSPRPTTTSATTCS